MRLGCRFEKPLELRWWEYCEVGRLRRGRRGATLDAMSTTHISNLRKTSLVLALVLRRETLDTYTPQIMSGAISSVSLTSAKSGELAAII